MDNDVKWFSVVCLIVALLIGFITYQVQYTNREFIKAGLSYKPVATTTYVTSWSR